MKQKISPVKRAYRAFEKEIFEMCRLECEYNLSSNDSVNSESLNYFHASDAVVLHFSDDYHFGNMRANTFVVEIGWHEWYSGEAFLVSANHKGTREMQLYIQKEED